MKNRNEKLWPGCRSFVAGATAGIEEARAMVRELLLEVERLYNQQIADATDAITRPERAAIVAWLRIGFDPVWAGRPPEEVAAAIASAIERGEHLK